MIFHRLYLRGFRSFHEPAEFVFGASPGVYFLTGDNQAEPTLGANGAGKSTVWEALCWVLYGKTSRNLKAGDVGTWEHKLPCEVELELTLGNERYVLKRTWSPNSLRLAPAEGTLPLRGKAQSRTTAVSAVTTDVTQEELEVKLGLSFNAFLHSVFFSQFNPTFLDLAPTDKATLLSDALKLDAWITMAQRATERAKEKEKEIAGLREDMARKEGRLQELECFSYAEDMKSWAATLKQEVKDVTEEVEEYKDNIASLDRELPNLASELKTLEALSKKSASLLNEHKVQLSDTQRLLSQRNQQLGRLRSKIEMAEDQSKRFEQEDQCPACLQEITQEHKTEQVTRLQMLIESIEDEVEVVQGDIRKLRESEHGTEADLDLVREELAATQAKIVSVKNAQNALRQTREELVRRVANLSEKALTLKTTTNPFIEKEEKRKRDVASLRSLLKVFDERKAAMEGSKAAYAFWAKGFKDLRLYLISDALKHLEVEVNSALMQLGLVDWRIEFAMETENKSGGLRRGFSVMIRSPHNQDPVPWEAWSGGESQRLRLAAIMGLSNLILESTGVSSNIEIYDEPSTWLSENGIYDLLDTLHLRSAKLERQVWVVDHRSLEFGGFQREVVVVKKPNKGSFIEELA